MTTTVWVRDAKTLRVHRRLREAGSLVLMVPANCPQDSAATYVVLTDAEMTEVEMDALCARCFPEEGDA